MRDEKEERKKQARSNKQTRQSNTALQLIKTCTLSVYVLQRGATQYDCGPQPLSLHQAREGLCPGPHWALLAEQHRQQAQPHCHIWGLSGTIYMIVCWCIYYMYVYYVHVYIGVYIMYIYMYQKHVLHAFGVCVIHACYAVVISVMYSLPCL